MKSKFYTSVILNKISKKIRLSYWFELCDMLSWSIIKKKSEKVEINIIYKQKADKIKSINLEKLTEKKSKINLK